jgi:CBS domain-containing protein
VFIGWFPSTAARATVGQMRIERMLARVREREAMESVRGDCVSGSESVADLALLTPEESGWEAFRRMVDRNVNQLPVVANGRLVGALTRERLMALVQAGAALARED